MTSYYHQVVSYNNCKTQPLSNPVMSEEIAKACVKWACSAPAPVVHKFLNQHFTCTVINEQHVMHNSLRKVKESALTRFSHDYHMKGFILDNVALYESKKEKVTRCNY